MPKALSGRGSVESAINPKMGTLTSRAAEDSAPFTEKVTLPLSPIRPINCRATCCQISVGSPSTARISSPDSSPARSATEPSTTELIIGCNARCAVSDINNPKNDYCEQKISRGASSRDSHPLPDAFCRERLRAILCGHSSGVWQRSVFLPEHAHIPPSGMGAITYSTPSLPTHVLTALPKPIENLRTLTPQRLPPKNGRIRERSRVFQA